MYHALRRPSRRAVITLEAGYRGATLAVLASTGSPFRQACAGPPPRVPASRDTTVPCLHRLCRASAVHNSRT